MNRHRPRSQRAGCKDCKPWKANKRSYKKMIKHSDRKNDKSFRDE